MRRRHKRGDRSSSLLAFFVVVVALSLIIVVLLCRSIWFWSLVWMKMRFSLDKTAQPQRKEERKDPNENAKRFGSGKEDPESTKIEWTGFGEFSRPN
jgi:hypothetical protein